MDKKCKMCGEEVGDEHSEATEDGEIVVVDVVKRAFLLDKGDCLCVACARLATYYRRIGL